MHFYPEGAIQSYAQLNRCAGCKVYYVHGLGRSSFLTEYTIHPDAVVDMDEDNDWGSPIPSIQTTTSMFCPGDVNIGKHHNRHYLFTDKTLAEQYLAYAKIHTTRLYDGGSYSGLDYLADYDDWYGED